MLIRWRIVWQVQMIKNIPRGVHSFAISQRLSIIYGNDLCARVLSPVAEIREETSTTTSFQLFISPFPRTARRFSICVQIKQTTREVLPALIFFFFLFFSFIFLASHISCLHYLENFSVVLFSVYFFLLHCFLDTIWVTTFVLRLKLRLEGEADSNYYCRVYKN